MLEVSTCRQPLADNHGRSEVRAVNKELFELLTDMIPAGVALAALFVLIGPRRSWSVWRGGGVVVSLTVLSFATRRYDQ
jgi:hypothetical protein